VIECLKEKYSQNVNLLSKPCRNEIKVPTAVGSVADPDPGYWSLFDRIRIRNRFLSGSRISDPESWILNPYLGDLIDNFLLGKKNCQNWLKFFSFTCSRIK
jgi:hypothetical protein